MTPAPRRAKRKPKKGPVELGLGLFNALSRQVDSILKMVDAFLSITDGFNERIEVLEIKVKKLERRKK